MRFARGLFFVALSVVCSLSVAWGQATTSLRGHVTDSSGAVIPGAQVKLSLTATGTIRQGTTDASGEYQFSQVSLGNTR